MFDGCGTVFKLAPDGTETVLHSFKGGSDGASPTGWLLRDKAGNLFGSTSEGGSKGCRIRDCCGVVFRIAPDGTTVVLHAFGGKDGNEPNGDLIADESGSRYGTAYRGGSHRVGTVFKLGK